MAGIDKTGINKGLKVLYIGQRMQKLVYGSETRVLFNTLKKNKRFCGDFYPIPVYHEDAAGGRSATFSDAQAGVSSVQIAQFQVDVVPNYQNIEITTDAMLRATDPGTFISKQMLRVDNAINNLSNNIELSLFRSNTGELGRVNATVTGGTLTLVTAKDAKNFFKGQRLVFSDTVGGALRDSGDYVTVTAVDRVGGTLTVVDSSGAATGLTGISGLTANDYIFAKGDASDTGSAKKISGLPDWIPASSPTSTAFFTVDRTADPVRLGGNRNTGSLGDIAKAIRDTATQVADMGDGIVDKVFCSFTTWGLLADQLDQDVLREPGASGVAGYQYLSVYGPRGVMKVVPATYCPENILWCLQTDTWELLSMGDPVRVNDDDGLIARAKYNAAALEVRCDSHAQLVCYKPGNNARCDLS